jgi:putative ABC transport system permease protein
MLTGLDAQIRLLDGALPAPAPDLSQPADVLVSRAFAETIGLNVGDELRTIATVRGNPIALPLRVSGIWEAVDPRDPAWPLQVDSFRDVLLVAEPTFVGPIAAALETPVSQVLWFRRLDPGALAPGQAAPLLGQVERLQVEAAARLPGLRIEQGPGEPLSRYRRAAIALAAQLTVVAAPTFGLVFGFVVLVAGLLAQRQAGEAALLVTRGVGAGQILAIATVEWLLLGALALVLGISPGLALARVVGATSSFLRLDPTLPPVAVTLTADAVGAALLVVGLALLAVLLPTASAARRTLADAQRSRSRASRPPFWQRAWLDVLLLIPALYGLWLLRRGDSLLGGRDPVAEPLLLVVPMLLCLSTGLLLARLLPRMFALLAGFAARLPWLAPVLALRVLARQPETYRGSFVLLVITLSLALVSAGVAATADTALHAAVAYRVGAQTQLIETGESAEAAGPGALGQDSAAERRDIREEPRFLFVPVSERLTVPGITAASPVGRYNAALRLGGAVTTAQLVGIDRLSFPQVTRSFDPAWADGASLGELMNRLAAAPDGVLVSRAALERGVQIGDRLPITAELFGDRRELSLRVVGVIDLWPGVNPQAGPILVMNLDALFDQMGGQYPFNVWIARDPDVPLASIAAGVRGIGVRLVDVVDAAALIRTEQARPERQGLFGMLSVGFVTSAGLSVVSFVLSTLIAARRRVVELGVLRAMGMPGGAVRRTLLLEHGTTIGFGLAGALIIGIAVALLVVPGLHVGVGPWPGIPPVAVAPPWEAAALLGIGAATALLAALLALLLMQRRLRLIEAVKLGEVS